MKWSHLQTKSMKYFHLIKFEVIFFLIYINKKRGVSKSLGSEQEVVLFLQKSTRGNYIHLPRKRGWSK